MLNPDQMAAWAFKLVKDLSLYHLINVQLINPQVPNKLKMEERQHSKCKQQTPYGLWPSKGPSVRSLGRKWHRGKWIDMMINFSISSLRDKKLTFTHTQSINPQTPQKDPKRPQNPKYFDPPKGPLVRLIGSETT